MIEWIRGENPQNTALAYFDAIATGDSAAALAAWDAPQAAVLPQRAAALQARRQATTQQLIDIGIDGDVRVLHTQWWRTCCEPGVIDAADGAGGARLRMEVLEQHGNPHV